MQRLASCYDDRYGSLKALYITFFLERLGRLVAYGYLVGTPLQGTLDVPYFIRTLALLIGIGEFIHYSYNNYKYYEINDFLISFPYFFPYYDMVNNHFILFYFLHFSLWLK